MDEGGAQVTRAPEFYHFASTNETYVFENPDIPAGQFLRLQGPELARYVDERAEGLPEGSSPPSDAMDSIEESLGLARQFLEEKKALMARIAKLEARLKRPANKVIEALESKLSGHDAMMKAALKRGEEGHKRAVEAIQREHKEAMVKLKVELKKLERKVEQGVNEALLRNGFDTKERALLRQIEELTQRIKGLDKALSEERQLVQSNNNAYARQRDELRQAKLDLEEFEAMKTRLIELEVSIRNKTEVRDACARFETERRKLQRDVRSERERGDHLRQELVGAREQLVEAERISVELRARLGDDEMDD
jgi:chromosome segregation ATPase